LRLLSAKKGETGKGEKNMKKTIFLSALLIAFALASGGETKAQIVKRIQFAKGKSSATVKGTTGIYGENYVLRAKSGQKLVIKLTPIDRIGIKVETESSYGHTVLLREARGGTYEVGLEESGDYTIFIGSTDKKPVSFTLTVAVTKLADI
jgi:hypothetical protein